MFWDLNYQIDLILESEQILAVAMLVPY